MTHAIFKRQKSASNSVESSKTFAEGANKVPVLISHEQTAKIFEIAK